MRRSDALKKGIPALSALGVLLIAASPAVAQISATGKYPELGRIGRHLDQVKRFRAQGIGVVSRIDRTAVTVSVLIDGCTTPSELDARLRDDIRGRLGKLGFSVGEVTSRSDGFLTAQIMGFNPKSRLLRLTRRFVPIGVRTIFIETVLYVVAEDLADHGYTGYEVDQRVNENTAISSLRTTVSAKAMFYPDGDAPEKIPWFGETRISRLWNLPLIDVLELRVSCSPHAEYAQKLSEAARNTVAFLDRLLAATDRMHRWIRERCRDGALPDDGKRQLRGNLDSLKNEAKEGRDWLDRLIEEMEQTRQRYVDCCDRGPYR